MLKSTRERIRAWEERFTRTTTWEDLCNSFLYKKQVRIVEDLEKALVETENLFVRLRGEHFEASNNVRRYSPFVGKSLEVCSSETGKPIEFWKSEILRISTEGPVDKENIAFVRETLGDARVELERLGSLDFDVYLRCIVELETLESQEKNHL